MSLAVEDIRLSQNRRLPSRAEVDRLEHLVVLAASPAALATLPYGALLAQRLRRERSAGGRRLLLTDLPNAVGTRVTLGTLAAAEPAFQRLTLARRLLAAHAPYRPRSLALAVAGYDDAGAVSAAEALVSAALAAVAQLPDLKSIPAPGARLRRLRLFGARDEQAMQRSFAEAEGNALARELSILPPNRLTPGHYLRRLRALADAHGWQLRFHGVRELARRGAGAFLAVAQGSPEADAGIARLSYRPHQAEAAPVALVGKGICYDTGGVNLKPARYMYGMHEDMQGSAVALGTLLALTRLQVNFAVDCWLALAMNHVGSRAYKPNDVVTALNGTTIEVVHTDAEGRMVLADTLALAGARRDLGLLLDYATLTGSCMQALGTAYSGVFSNRPAYLAELIAAGQASGERVWPFPLDADYDQGLQSSIADVKQCAPDGQADHILAARFLQRFIRPGLPWIHLDLASSSHKGGLAHVPTATTGFGVRFSLRLLLDHDLD